MSDLRTAAQQALGRLRMYYYGTGFAEDAECIAALEAALAQQEEPVEPVQEPEGLDWRYTARIGYVVKPYTAPPQRKPLAEWQINDLMSDIDPEDVCSWSFRQGVYAAEKHHGVKL